MAKDKAKGDKSGKKKPGQGGTSADRIPNALREAGQRAADLVQNPVARSMLAAGLVTAAAALTANQKVREGVRQAGRDAAEGADAAADSAGKIGAALVTAFTEGVKRWTSASGSSETKSEAEPVREEPLSAATSRPRAAEAGTAAKAKSGAGKAAKLAKSGAAKAAKPGRKSGAAMADAGSAKAVKPAGRGKGRPKKSETAASRG